MDEEDLRNFILKIEEVANEETLKITEDMQEDLRNYGLLK